MEEKKTKIYAEILEDSALEQFNEAMSQDFVVQGALMPDAHTGYTLPIGSVIATKGVVVPAYVGYDIGCGMCAIKTTFNKSEVVENAAEILAEIYHAVPVGRKKHCAENDYELAPLIKNELSKLGQWCYGKRDAARQLGTLGGGNHFIEMGYDSNDFVCIVIHSGSRGFGHGLAGEYMKLASKSEKAKEGHYPLDVDSDIGRDYIGDLTFALKYALLNRKKMIESVIGCISVFCDGKALDKTLINKNHNHAEYSNGLWIHRKGATHAELGMMGVIPGNMRDGSFIVRGKGCADSMSSSSHGAGRIMSRSQARKTISVEEMKEQMVGIVSRCDAEVVDEAPSAYKNIFDVMKAQEDLVEIVDHIKPLINAKG